ncbi:MAG: hypothetical protein ACI8W8_004017 [Rhodothermales bacterium]|jgi:hypothetical protein
MQSIIRQADLPTRRHFMRELSASLFGLSFLDSYGATSSHIPGGGTAKRCIYLYMSGGMSHIDTFDPKPEGGDTAGPFTPLKTKADGVRVSELFPTMAKVMNHVVTVNSMSSTQGAHAQGYYMFHTNYEKRATIVHPSLGAWTSQLSGKRNRNLPTNVIINNPSNFVGSGYLENRHAPLPVGDPAAGLQNSKRAKDVKEDAFRRRLTLANTFNKEFESKLNNKHTRAYKDAYVEALRLMHTEDLAAFDISKEPAAIREAYGEHPFGQGCLLARRLVEHNISFIEVNYGGWDTHRDNFGRLREQTSPLDQGLGTLIADLAARGLLEDTLVVLGTEFGRTPNINSNDGRDHYPKAFSCLMAGGGVRGGQTYGATDKQGREVVDKKVRVQDFNTTIAHALGLDHTNVITAPNGRPFTMGNKGKVLPIF